MKDVTGVIMNWLSANSTLRAINSLRKFYPLLPIVIVDDGSGVEDKNNFFRIYNSNSNNPDLMYDPDMEKLKEIPNCTLVTLPFYKHEYVAGEGLALDMALKTVKTKWMLHFHSDYRFTKPGAIEELLSHADKNTIGVGEDKTKVPGYPSLSGVLELINAHLGKKHTFTFQPVYLYPDGTISVLDNKAPVEYKSEDKTLISMEGYFFGSFFKLGYKVVDVKNIVKKYGVHLRWEGDINLWNKIF